MLRKIREKYRKMNKEADDRNIKLWKKHPKLNKWIVSLFSISMVIASSTVVILALFGYIIKEISDIIVIGSIIGSLFGYSIAIWTFRYSKRIAKKALPKSN